MLELISTTWHLVSSILVFIIGLMIVLSIRKSFKCRQDRVILLYLWHSLFCMVFLLYTLSNPADSIKYFITGSFNSESFSLGTKAIISLVGLLKLFDLSYLGCFLVFNIFGTIGLIAFDGSLRQLLNTSSNQLKLFGTIIVFLPSISFWSSAIGKDAISFMSVGFALWAALDFKNRKLLFATAVILMLFVRPHMAGLLILAVGGSVIFDKSTNIKVKILVGSVAAAVSVVLVPFALNYAGVGDTVDSNSLQSYIEKRQGYNMQGGGSVDIANMSLPMQMVTYLFRPLPFEARGISSLASSIDNTLLLFLFFWGIRKIKKIKSTTSNLPFMWFYALSSLLILSMITANLGIAMRQKWMFMPMFIYLFVAAIAQSRKRR